MHCGQWLHNIRTVGPIRVPQRKTRSTHTRVTRNQFYAKKTHTRVTRNQF